VLSKTFSLEGMIFYKNNILKNLIFSIVALLFTVSSFAQLYVKPNDNGTPLDDTDDIASYIYVKDEVLFVNEDIGLTENPTGTTEASIYLRDEAQLIQGDDVENSGTGYISILQNNPLYDAWDYAFWSSPVGDQTIGATGNQNFGALRFFNPQGAKDVACNCFLGTDSSVNIPTNALNGIQSPMQISRRWLYTYTNTTWSRFNDNTDVLPGLGFTMKGLGDAKENPIDHDQTYDFRGRANNGNINAPILAGESSLSGNPYPSALDLNEVFYENTDIESFRYWDEDWTKDGHYFVNNKGGYGIWIPLAPDPGGTTNQGMYTPATFWNYDNNGGQGSAAGAGEMYQRRFAPVGQGFMIYGKPTAGGSITYNNSQRVYVLESSGMSDLRLHDDGPVVNGRSDSEIVATSMLPADNRIPHLRLDTSFNETHIRQLVLAFSNESTDGVDRGFDAKSPLDSDSDVYFPITVTDEDISPFVIQTVPFDIYKQIPYAIVLDVLTTIVVTTAEKVNFEGSVFLYDSAEGTYQKINSKWQPSAQLNLPAGNYKDRFFITFLNRHKAQDIAIENTENFLLKDVKFFQNNTAQQLEVANPEGYNIASVSIFGMSGKMVYTSSNLGNNNRLTFPTGNLSEGIYLVMLTTADNITINHKITVHKK
jgi:hypothetical protein